MEKSLNLKQKNITVRNILKNYYLYDSNLEKLNFALNVLDCSAADVIYKLHMRNIIDNPSDFSEQELAVILSELISKCNSESSDYDYKIYEEMARIGLRTEYFIDKGTFIEYDGVEKKLKQVKKYLRYSSRLLKDKNSYAYEHTYENEYDEFCQYTNYDLYHDSCMMYNCDDDNLSEEFGDIPYAVYDHDNDKYYYESVSYGSRPKRKKRTILFY